MPDEPTSVEEERLSTLEAELADDLAQKGVTVWYASYGSNLLQERFDCYLFGGKVQGMSRVSHGARDATPARESAVLRKPYRVFFAHARESHWGFGGAAMLDLTPTHPSETLIRLYKVTLQQFNDIVAQENGLIPPLRREHRLKCDDLAKLREGEAGSLSVQFKGGRNYYPAVAYLGEHMDVPILTFTCLQEDVSEFLSGALSAAPPAKNYLNVLMDGVQNLPEVEVDGDAYWKERIQWQFGETLSN